MLTREEEEVLQRTFLFSGYSEEEVVELSSKIPFTCMNYKKGDSIFTPEDYRKELGVILCGKVQVTKGEGDFVVNCLGAGDLFGTAALFNNEDRYVSTLVTKAPCRVLFIPEEELRKLVDADIRIRWNYIRYQANKIRFLNDKVDYLIQGSGAKKLSSFLLQQMGESGTVHLDCSMTELAARLKVSRAALYRDLNRLERLDLVQRAGKEITVRNPGALAQQ
jgi:CRP-like cAMP-binding protein